MVREIGLLCFRTSPERQNLMGVIRHNGSQVSFGFPPYNPGGDGFYEAYARQLHQEAKDTQDFVRKEMGGQVARAELKKYKNRSPEFNQSIEELGRPRTLEEKQKFLRRLNELYHEVKKKELEDKSDDEE